MRSIRRQDQDTAGQNRKRGENVGEARAHFRKCHRPDRGNQDRCADRARRCRFPQQNADEKIDQQQIEAVHSAHDHQAVGQRQQMAQIINREIDRRIEIGLEAGRQRINAVAAVDHGPDIVLVVILPVPVDVFADKPGVDRAGQQRAERDGDRHQNVGLKNRRLPGSVRGPSCIRTGNVSGVCHACSLCRPGDLALGTTDTSRMPALTIREAQGASLRLEAAGANHLAPFVGFVCDQSAEIGR